MAATAIPPSASYALPAPTPAAAPKRADYVRKYRCPCCAGKRGSPMRAKLRTASSIRQHMSTTHGVKLAPGPIVADADGYVDVTTATAD